MNGSPKQVAWATKIKENMLAQLECETHNWNGPSAIGCDPEVVAEAHRQIADCRAKIEAVEDCQYFIRNKDTNLHLGLEKVMRAFAKKNGYQMPGLYLGTHNIERRML